MIEYKLSISDFAEELRQLMIKHNIKSIEAINDRDMSYIKIGEDKNLSMVGLYISHDDKH